MEMMEAGIVSLDTHPDPKLPTASTARPFQRLSHRPHARHCIWSRAVAHRSQAPALKMTKKEEAAREKQAREEQAAATGDLSLLDMLG